MDKDYEDFFNGKCPYTDEPCLTKISCIRCQSNEREKALMEEMDEMERFEILCEEVEQIRKGEVRE